MSLRHRIVAVGLALTAIGTVTTAGSAAAAAAATNGCGRQFDSAVSSYLRTTDARDARGFTALLHPDVVGVLPGGTVFDGKKAMAGFITTFFARTDWTQTFSLKRKVVSDCESGYVLFESVYAEPAAGYSQKLMIGVSWTREHGRWLVLADQNTEVT
jgi:uncharacterized protein (TIGR02246 family)